MRLGLSFDLRNPPQWEQPWPDHYRRSLDLLAEADRLGIEVVKFPEHHLIVDGYIPQGLTFMAAAAVRTSRVRLATGPLLAPLHRPADIAEQAAVVDCLSDGRVELALGAGSRRREFELFGVEMDRRFGPFEATVREVRRLLDERIVTPGPVQARVPMWAAVTGPRGSRLAGELGMGLYYLETKHWDAYLEGLDAGGHGRDEARLCGSLSVVLTEDPERALATWWERIEHDRFTYAEMLAEGDPERERPVPWSMDELGAYLQLGRRSQRAGGHERADAKPEHLVHVMTPEDVAERVAAIADRRPVHTLFIAGTVSGAVDDAAFEHLRLAATRLKPLLDAIG